jgi:shikimate dehydrogenase
MKLFGVAGDPILHSRSPDLFNGGFSAISFDGRYLLLASSSAKEAIAVAKEIGFSGLNITSPFKEEAFRLVDEVDDVAKEVEAVNTVVFSEGRARGLNTDVEGVRGALLENGVPLSGKRIAVLGAGGSARAACYALSSYGRVSILNRTLDRAVSIAEKFGGDAYGPGGWELLREMDIIVLCLPIEPPIPASVLRPGQTILNANYSKAWTFEDRARIQGVKLIDGREWLFFQALRPFELFTSSEAPKGALREALCRPRRISGLICLCGFMGSGKTTVGKVLAERLNMPFVDIDERIERKTGRTVEEIFERDGEHTFRRLEEEEIRRMKDMEKAVVAVGGGAVLNENTRHFLRENSLVVWLWANRETTLQRLHHDMRRPLLRGDKARIVEELLRTRIPLYANCSHLVVPTEGKSPEAIAERIRKEIDHAG